MKKLYVGNPPFTATDDQGSQLFGQHGAVHAVALINDRETGRPRGFVEVDDDAEQTMIQARDGKDMGGRALRVDEALNCPRNDGTGGGGSRRRPIKGQIPHLLPTTMLVPRSAP